MIRQYHAPRHRREPHNPGTVPIGTIIYLQDRMDTPSFREPWIIEAWLPRRIEAYKQDASGRWTLPCFTATTMTTARARSLRTNRIVTVEHHRIIACVDAGFERH